MADSPLTVAVVGLGRSGTSLMCQMLAGGGLPVAGLWPGFEIEEVLGLPDATGFLDELDRKAVKILDPHRHTPPTDRRWRFIWMDRNPSQQARSSVKLLALHGIPATPAEQLGIKGMLIEDRLAALAHLRSSAYDAELIVVRFEQLLRRKRRTAERVASFLAADGFELNVDAMVDQVVDRPTRCLDGMLELDQMSRLLAEASGQGGLV